MIGDLLTTLALRLAINTLILTAISIVLMVSGVVSNSTIDLCVYQHSSGEFRCAK